MLVVVVVRLVQLHAFLRHTRRRALEAPVKLVVTREVIQKIIGPKVAAILAVKFVATMAGIELIRAGIIDGHKILILIVIVLAADIELAGDSAVVIGTADIEVDMGVFAIVAIGIDLLIFRLVTIVGGKGGSGHQGHRRDGSSREGGQALRQFHESPPFS